MYWTRLVYCGEQCQRAANTVTNLNFVHFPCEFMLYVKFNTNLFHGAFIC
jgi:hypothetical protein